MLVQKLLTFGKQSGDVMMVNGAQKVTRQVARRLCVVLVFALAAGQAQAVPLSDLLQGGSIQVGDKLFDMFALIPDPTDPEQGDALDLSAIDVTGIGDGTAGNEYGLNFDIGITIGSENPQDTDFLNLLFGYRASVTAPGNQLAGITMAGDLEAVGDNAFVSINKDVFDLQASFLGSLFVGDDTLLPPEQLQDSAAISPLDAIFVVDTIDMFYDAAFGPSVAVLNSYEQRFIQVPVPATLALVLLGLFGLMRARS